MTDAYTARECGNSIVRELKHRKRLYPRWVKNGRMDESHAEQEIAIFEQIRDHYHQLALSEDAETSLKDTHTRATGQTSELPSQSA